MGTLLAGLLSCGWPPTEIEAELFSLRKCAGALLDIDLRGVIRNGDDMIYGRRIEGLLHELTQGLQFSACGDSLAFLAARCDNMKPVVLRSGCHAGDEALSTILRACIAEPGIMHPREICGTWLYQGGETPAIEFAGNMAGKVLVVSGADASVPRHCLHIELDHTNRDWLEDKSWIGDIHSGEQAAMKIINELVCLLKSS